jgi:hypothetical protein
MEESEMIGKLFKAKTSLWSRSLSMDKGEIILVTDVEDPHYSAVVWKREITCLINGNIRRVGLTDFKSAIRHGELKAVDE